MVYGRWWEFFFFFTYECDDAHADSFCSLSNIVVIFYSQGPFFKTEFTNFFPNPIRMALYPVNVIPSYQRHLSCSHLSTHRRPYSISQLVSHSASNLTMRLQEVAPPLLHALHISTKGLFTQTNPRNVNLTNLFPTFPITSQIKKKAITHHSSIHTRQDKCSRTRTKKVFIKCTQGAANRIEALTKEERTYIQEPLFFFLSFSFHSHSSFHLIHQAMLSKQHTHPNS